MFACADEDTTHTGILRPANIVLDIVADHHRFIGSDTN